MSFLDKFSTKGRRKNKATDDDLGSIFDEVVPLGTDDAAPAPASSAALTLDMNAATQSPASAGSSILSEALPSETAGEFVETRLPGVDDERATGTGLPLIGALPLAQQQRILSLVVAIGLTLLGLGAYLAIDAAGRSSAQVGATGQAMMQSQRLAKSVTQAFVGSAAAFPEVRESAEVLARNLRGLKDGSAEMVAAPAAAQEAIEPMMVLVDRAEKNAAVVVGQQKTLTQVGQALRAINRQSSDLLETAETVLSLKLQQDASAGELSAVGQLVMLTQRIGKSANEFLTTEGVSPEAVFLLGKDLGAFREITTGLLNGSSELRLSATKDAQTRERLTQLMAQYEKTRAEATAILGNLQGLVAAREAQVSVVADSEPLRKGLEVKARSTGGWRLAPVAPPAAPAPSPS